MDPIQEGTESKRDPFKKNFDLSRDPIQEDLIRARGRGLINKPTMYQRQRESLDDTCRIAF